jgi:hypothetical protein
MPTFKSGAFAQQCFSSHPHSLTFKSLTAFSPAITPAHPGVAITPASPEPAETGSFSRGTAPLPLAPSLPPDGYLTPPAPGPPRGAVRPVGRVPDQHLDSGIDTAPVYRVVVTCNACDMRHRFAIQTLTSRLGQREERDTEAISQLSSCATAHCLDLRVSSMDVINDSVGLRCGECHRAYHLGVSAIETYQK